LNWHLTIFNQQMVTTVPPRFYDPSALTSVRFETGFADSHVFTRPVAKLSALRVNHLTIPSAARHILVRGLAAAMLQMHASVFEVEMKS
jgi:hypothetical protein